MNVDQIRAKIAKIRFDLAALECPSITSDDVADVSDAYQDRLEYNGWVYEKVCLDELLN